MSVYGPLVAPSAQYPTLLWPIRAPRSPLITSHEKTRSMHNHRASQEVQTSISILCLPTLPNKMARLTRPALDHLRTVRILQWHRVLVVTGEQGINSGERTAAGMAIHSTIPYPPPTPRTVPGSRLMLLA